MKRFYAAESANGSPSSMGFANDWVVFVFSSRKARDAYVVTAKNLSTRAILRSEATKYATNACLSGGGDNAPVHFSGEFWYVEEFGAADYDIDGLIGTLDVTSDDYYNSQRFYK